MDASVEDSESHTGSLGQEREKDWDAFIAGGRGDLAEGINQDQSTVSWKER